MRLIIAIRGTVADEAEAIVIRDKIQEALTLINDDDLDLTCEVSAIIKPSISP